MVQLPDTVLTTIANYICGDAGGFKYRKGSELTTFFSSLGLPYVHDGSTRKWWTLGVLQELNSQGNRDPGLPSEKLSEVLEFLVHPSHDQDQKSCISLLNKLLSSYRLELAFLDDRNNVALIYDDPSGTQKAYHEKSQIQKVKRVSEFETMEPESQGIECDIFISYAETNRKLASELKEALETPLATGESPFCFMAAMDIKAGDIWEEKIRQAIISSKKIVVLVTPDSIRRPWILMEIGAGWVLQKPLIAALQQVDPTEIEHPLSKYQAGTINSPSEFTKFVSEVKNSIVQ
ncbi:MAG: toll/interleukin-1 receptor domain-containing protein [Promethearchaeota archaeon]